MPAGDEAFAIDFDFLDHTLFVRTSDGRTRALPLLPRSVADFYAGLGSATSFAALRVEGEARHDWDADRWDSVVGSGRLAW